MIYIAIYYFFFEIIFRKINNRITHFSFPSLFFLWLRYILFKFTISMVHTCVARHSHKMHKILFA